MTDQEASTEKEAVTVCFNVLPIANVPSERSESRKNIKTFDQIQTQFL
jgi:hypothetical protein